MFDSRSFRGCWNEMAKFFVFFVMIGNWFYVEGATQFQGTTMGTSYQILIEDPLSSEVQKELPEAISQVLGRVIETLSHWEPRSEISKLNRDPRSTVEISAEFSKVLREALWVHRVSRGAFDVTVAPLVKLWGFGPMANVESPKMESVIQIRSQTGMSKIALDSQRRLRRLHSGLTLDLSAIAKGYAVDQVVERLSSYGMKNLLVEIGGEVRAIGRKHDGSLWRVAIQMPKGIEKVLSSEEGGGESFGLWKSISVIDQAVATSGTYEHRDSKGRHHIIDPRTGFPTQNGVVSVTVITQSCMRADALATALVVMGVKEGLQLISSLKETDALFLVEEPSSKIPTSPLNMLRAVSSPGFAKKRLVTSSRSH